MLEDVRDGERHLARMRRFWVGPRAAQRGFVVFLARQRLAAVGLALLVETGALLLLAYAEPSNVVGIPAAVAAAIAGTVAVVFGPLDGAVVAFVGAVVFAAAGGWEPGELAALAVWPAVVVAAGLFARRVARQREALHSFVAAHEQERQRLALELHEETAQVLAAALLAHRRAEGAQTESERAEASALLRDLLDDSIQAVRSLAVELRPRALDDFGLRTALEHLCSTFSARTGIDVALDAGAATNRLPADVELVLFRIVQETLAGLARAMRANSVRISLLDTGGVMTLTVEDDGGEAGSPGGRGERADLIWLRERTRLLGGRLTVVAHASGTTLRAEIPLPPSGQRPPEAVDV